MVPGREESGRAAPTSHDVAEDRLPSSGPVLVAGRHAAEELHLDEAEVWPFPRSADGTYAGEPTSGVSAVAHLEALRAAGAAFLILPHSTAPWLRRYPEFGRHLRRYYHLAPDEEGNIVVALRERPPPRESEALSVIETLAADFYYRFHRYPAILDWDTGLQLAAILPQYSVFSPVNSDAVLPYLDRSVDLVVVSTDDPLRLADARRVAGTAVVHVGRDDADPSPDCNGSQPAPAVRVAWTVEVDALTSPSISIVIAADASGEGVDAAIQALTRTLPWHDEGEVILVGDAAGEGGTALDALNGRARIVRAEAHAELCAAWNRGAAEASGDILVFVARDALLLPGWHPFVLRTFQDYPRAGVVCGKVIGPDGDLREAGDIGPTETVSSVGSHAAGDAAYQYVREVTGASAVFLATRRTLFLEIGGLTGQTYADIGAAYCRGVRERGSAVYYQPRVAAVYPIATAPRAAAAADVARAR